MHSCNFPVERVFHLKNNVTQCVYHIEAEYFLFWVHFESLTSRNYRILRVRIAITPCEPTTNTPNSMCSNRHVDFRFSSFQQWYSMYEAVFLSSMQNFCLRCMSILYIILCVYVQRGLISLWRWWKKVNIVCSVVNSWPTVTDFPRVPY
jgi:hypothetical protein